MKEFLKWAYDPYLKIVLILLVGLCIGLVCGCRSVRYVPVEAVRTDSTVIRDTALQVVLVPYKDSVSVRDTTSYLCNPYAYSYASWSGGMLHHSLGIFPMSKTTVRVPYFIDRYVRIKEPKIVEVEKRLTRMQRVYMAAGKVLLLGIIPFAMIIVGWLVYKKMDR